MSSSAEAAPIEKAAHRRRVVLATLTLLAIVGAIALGTLLGPPGGGRPLDVELASSADGFRTALEPWRQPTGTGTCGIGSPHDGQGGSVVRLECNLFVDSVVFVPGYVGLLVLFLLVLGREVHPLRHAVVHLLCLVPVAAGVFDIAENGMTARAAADELERLLANGTVLDVRHASLIKWTLLEASFALVAYHGAAVAYWKGSMARAPRVLLAAGVLFATVTALLLAIGLLGNDRWIAVGGYAATAALLSLVAWQVAALRSPTDRASA